LVAGFCDLVAADVFEFGSSLYAEWALRIEAEKILIGRFCLVEVGEVALVNFGFGEQGAEAVAAGGILTAEKFILADGIAESFLILKDATFFGEEVGDGGDAGVSFGRCGVAVVDGAIGVEDTIVLKAGALLFGSAFEGFAETLGVGEVGGSGCGILRGGDRRGSERENREGEEAETGRIWRGGQHRGSDSALHRRRGRPSSTGQLCTRGRERLCRGHS
jgi:hypothetical protein